MSTVKGFSTYAFKHNAFFVESLITFFFFVEDFRHFV